jgi:hypothetical protein
MGVVGDAHLNALNDDDAVAEYRPAQTDDMPNMSMVVKMSGPPDSFTPIAKAIVESLDPKTFPEIRPLKGLFDENVSKVEQVTMVVSLIGVVAVLLAGVGIGPTPYRNGPRRLRYGLHLGRSGYRCWQRCCARLHGP